MKFLIDAQLPRKWSVYLQDKGYDAVHTLDLPQKNKTTDTEINALSMQEERILISKDSDFYDSYLQKVEPYKLIYLTTGNISTPKLLDLFEKNAEKIFEEIAYNSLVEVSRTSIISIL